MHGNSGTKAASSETAVFLLVASFPLCLAHPPPALSRRPRLLPAVAAACGLTGRQVSSFRIEKPSAGLRKLLDAVHQQIRDEEREKMAAQAALNSEGVGEVRTRIALPIHPTQPPHPPPHLFVIFPKSSVMSALPSSAIL